MLLGSLFKYQSLMQNSDQQIRFYNKRISVNKYCLNLRISRMNLIAQFFNNFFWILVVKMKVKLRLIERGDHPSQIRVNKTMRTM